MKFTILRAAAALSLMLALAGCGGKAAFQITGTITGLHYSGLVLTTNGQKISPVPDATAFFFPQTVDYGTTYDVLIDTDPLHETCTVLNGNDSAGRTAAIQTIVSCANTQHNIGGTVTGLTGDGLILANGSLGGTLPVAATATTFTFPSTAGYGDAFGITVLSNPTGQTCTVSNGTRLMGDADVTDIAVTCVTNPS